MLALLCSSKINEHIYNFRQIPAIYVMDFLKDKNYVFDINFQLAFGEKRFLLYYQSRTFLGLILNTVRFRSVHSFSCQIT